MSHSEYLCIIYSSFSSDQYLGTAEYIGAEILEGLFTGSILGIVIIIDIGTESAGIFGGEITHVTGNRYPFRYFQIPSGIYTFLFFFMKLPRGFAHIRVFEY
jgi:hypothetical protein